MMGVEWGGGDKHRCWLRLAVLVLLGLAIFLIASGPWVVSGGVP